MMSSSGSLTDRQIQSCRRDDHHLRSQQLDRTIRLVNAVLELARQMFAEFGENGLRRDDFVPQDTMLEQSRTERPW